MLPPINQKNIMRLKNIKSHFKITLPNRLLPTVSFFAVLFFCFVSSDAHAQVANQSDWNVPPPLAPGTISKGDVEGRPGSSSVAVLRISDVAVSVQPAAPYPVPELAPLSPTPPVASQPEQPAGDMMAALPDTPLPEAPQAPQMPDRTMQDAPEPPRIAVPMPVAPELPAPPQMPSGSTSPVTTNNGLFPLMPAVTQSTPLTPAPATTILWKTPGVPESINLN